MTTAVYPGSFDPITNGHLDMIGRASRMFDRVVVGVLCNASKTPLFSVEERVRMIEKATKKYKNVEVRDFSGLTVDFAREQQASCLLRGIRNASDTDYEMQLAVTNRALYPDIDTVLLPADPSLSHISSSLVKEIASYNGDLSSFVPPFVAKAVSDKLNKE